MKKSFSVLIFIVVSFFCFSPFIEARVYKIGMSPWMAYSPNNVADIKGFWAEQGLQVKVVVDPEMDDKALLEKRVDILHDVVGLAVSLSDSNQEGVVILETDWSFGGDKIILKKDTDLKSLKGERVGLYYNRPVLLLFLAEYLSSQGFKLSDFKLEEHVNPNQLTDLFIKGDLKMILNYDPEAKRAEYIGKGKAVFTSRDAPGLMPEGWITTRENLKTIPPEDLKKLYRGWFKAVLWMQDPKNFSEFVGIANKLTFQGSKFSPIYFRQLLENVKFHSPSELRNNLKQTQNYLNRLKLFMRQNNLLKQDFSEEGRVYTPVLENLLKELP